MRSTVAFGRLEQFHFEPELDVGRAIQRPDAARPLFEKRTEPAGVTPTVVSFGLVRLLRTQFLFAGKRQACASRNSRSGNPDCFAWLRSLTRRKDGVQLDLAQCASQRGRAHEEILRDFLPRGAHGHRDEPEPGDGGRQPDLVEGGDQAVVDSHRDHLPPLGERPRVPESRRGDATLVSIARSN